MKSKSFCWSLIAVGILLMLGALAIPEDAVALAALCSGLAVLLAGVVINERHWTTDHGWPE